MPRRRIWLSVDWDFFQEERPEWDWGHSEAGPIWSQIAWLSRTHNFRGEDIKPITSPDLHAPKASGFWFDVASRYAGRPPLSIGVADSHGLGLPFFYQLGQSHGCADEIWNFDAHHDLGYHALPKLRQWAKEGRAEAGSWLFVLLKTYKQLACRFIHPAWKDPTLEPDGWAKDAIAKRVRRTNASAFDWSLFGSVDIAGVFIAKSESWSPPWNDEAFARFVGDAEHHLGADVEPWGKADAREPRPWDGKAAEEIQAMTICGRRP